MDLYDALGILTWVFAGLCGVLAAVRLRRTRGGSADLATSAAVWGLTAILAAVCYQMSVASYAIRSDVYFMSLALRVLGSAVLALGGFLLELPRKILHVAGLWTLLAAAVLLIASLIVMDLLSGWLVTAISAAGLLALYWAVLGKKLRQTAGGRAVRILLAAAASLLAGRALAGLVNMPTGSALVMFLGVWLLAAAGLLAGMRAGSRSAPAAYVQAACFGGAVLVALSVSPVLDVVLM